MPADEITLKDLKVKFESLGVKAPKSQQLARYLVEPKTGGEVVFNENAYCTQKEAIDHLYTLIGPYKIYSAELKGEDYTSDAKMQKAAIDKFGRVSTKQALEDALTSEDYEDTGILELTQVREAIQSLDDDLDHHLMDWLLYYVYSRSDHVDRMEYKVLLQMLDEITKKGSGPAKKLRPQSSSAGK